VQTEASAGIPAELAGLPALTLDEGQLGDLELLLTGAFAPLHGYLTPAEVMSVSADGTLPDGTPWPVPVTLDVPAGHLKPDAARLLLQDPEGTPLAVLDITDRLPLPDALRRFADELNDPGADLIIAALIINARLRGPGLRDLLGALSASVREELDMRRKVNAERRSTRRSAQIVVGVSVGLALGLALFNRSYVHTYDSPLGQLVLAVVVALYAGGFVWMRKLATFETPERLLLGPGPAGPDSAERALASPGARS
jgi:hypothetical protein